MRLIITEKPSVALLIAEALNIKTRKDGYIVGENDIISWCIGHLVKPAETEFYNEKYSKWKFDDLPIIPEKWKFIVLQNSKKQYEVLEKLMLSKDVDYIVCATDAGREGELIFRLVYNQCLCDKPVKRLWIASMEEKAILEGLENMKSDEEYENLYQAALCRSKADWLVGINGTRLFSILYGKTLNIGRVITPTLSMIVEREKSIKEFRKEKFYTIELDCNGFKAVSEKFSDKKKAEEIKKNCDKEKVIIISIQEQDKKENPPKLYDLTTLQREANKIYGYTAQQTLDYLQSLYEHKLVTYPRTDSRYLTDDMMSNISPLVNDISKIFPFTNELNISVNPKLITDSSKVTDHHAIIPTQTLLKSDISKLPSGENNILKMVCIQFICSVGESYITSETTTHLKCKDYEFTAKGKVIKSLGWKEIMQAYQKEFKQENKSNKTVELPKLEKGQEIENIKATIKEGTTTPPKHFTEDTLLSAMENSKSSEFLEIKDIERKGLGTPATRAGIIEKLVKSELIERKSEKKSKIKYLLPTEKGNSIISIVPYKLKSAKMTAEWESDLKKVELGELDSDTFLNNITEFIHTIVKEYEGQEPKREIIGKCPFCGKNVYESSKNYFCVGYKDTPKCEFTVWKNNKFFDSIHKPLTKDILIELLKNGEVKATKLFSEKKQKYYDATIILDSMIDENGKKRVNFKLEFEKQ